MSVRLLASMKYKIKEEIFEVEKEQTTNVKRNGKNRVYPSVCYNVKYTWKEWWEFLCTIVVSLSVCVCACETVKNTVNVDGLIECE